MPSARNPKKTGADKNWFSIGTMIKEPTFMIPIFASQTTSPQQLHDAKNDDANPYKTSTEYTGPALHLVVF